jgi:hypothetical protein
VTGFSNANVAVKILPHPHSAFCTRGIPPNVARSGDVNFGYPGVLPLLTFNFDGGGGLDGVFRNIRGRHTSSVPASRVVVLCFESGARAGDMTATL